MLLHPLLVVALVGFYPTNKLISHRPLPKQSPKATFTLITYDTRAHPELSRLSAGYAELRGRLPMCYSPVCHARRLAALGEFISFLSIVFSLLKTSN